MRAEFGGILNIYARLGEKGASFSGSGVEK